METRIEFELGRCLNADSCIYKEYGEECPMRLRPNVSKDYKCNKDCMMLKEVRNWISKSGIPYKYARVDLKQLEPGEDLKAFEILREVRNNVDAFVREGKQVFIYSYNCGNGKTTWACKILLNYIKMAVDNGWVNLDYDTAGLFINVEELLFRLKKSISYKDGELDELIQRIYLAPIVVWDDACGKKLTDYEYSAMYSLINRREADGLCNIYTCNRPIDSCREVWGDRLVDRMTSGLVVVLSGDSKRANV